VKLIPGGRLNQERRGGARQKLGDPEQIVCTTCENETGVATSLWVDAVSAPRRSFGGKIGSGTRAIVCAYCMGRGKVTELVGV
jgi:hypothetical protein